MVELETLLGQLEKSIDSMDAGEVLNRERKERLEYDERIRRFTELLKKFQEQVCKPLRRSYGIRLDERSEYPIDVTIYSKGITVHRTEYAGETHTLFGCYPKEKIRTEELSAEGFVEKYAYSGHLDIEDVTRKLLGHMPAPKQGWDG